MPQTAGETFGETFFRMATSQSSSPHETSAAYKFLAERIDYERTRFMPADEKALKLERMRELLHRLGSPQEKVPAIHIAGTKGKGSTAAMLAAMLHAGGYHVGLFTSPHLERVEERIAVDGRPCSPEDFTALLETVRAEVETMDREAAAQHPPEHGPTYFEILTAMAFLHFVRQKVDLAVMEVGLGGRLDSTNVCRPALTIITSISFDHTQQLGHTLAAIAGEKAGILKPGVPVISGVTAREPREVIRRRAEVLGCPLWELERDFDFHYHPPRNLEVAAKPATFDFFWKSFGGGCWKDVTLPLLGHHQAANAAVALAASSFLVQQGWKLPESALRRGLAEVYMPARIEVVSRHPTVILDAAHNVASIEALITTIEESFSARRRLLIFAASHEKDVGGMLRLLLGSFDHIIFTCYRNNPRGLPSERLYSLAAAPVICNSFRPCRMEMAIGPAEAWSAARRSATPEDLLCITGSFFLAAEIRPYIASDMPSS